MLGLLLAGQVQAQAEPTQVGPANAEADSAAAATAPSGAEGVPPPALEEGACFPPCRDGFMCHSGQCISACNPPCPDGSQCAGHGRCEPLWRGGGGDTDQEGPNASWPPVPPSELNQPVPPDAWQPVFPEPEPEHPFGPRNFIGTVGLQLSMGGTGHISYEDEQRADASSRSFDLAVGGGVEGTFEFRLTRYFGVGPGLRIFRTSSGGRGAASVELLAVPTVYVPLGQVEFMLPLPIGLSFGPVPSLDDKQGGGLTVGFTPGVLAWLSPQVGVFTQLGVTWHARGYAASDSDYSYRFYRPVFNLGLVFSD